MLDELKGEISRVARALQPECGVAAGRLSVRVIPANWLPFLELVCRENTLAYSRLRCLTAVRREDGGTEVVAELSSPYWPELLSVRVKLGPNQGISSLRSLWPYADWLEWEMCEQQGLRIEGGRPERPFDGFALARALASASPAPEGNA